MHDYKKEELSVLEIKFEDNSKLYLNGGSYVAVSNPEDATRYYPLTERAEERQKSRDKDLNWMAGSFEAEFSFVPLTQAIEDFKNSREV